MVTRSRMPPPKMNRHFRSRLVSPSKCLKVRYDTGTPSGRGPGKHDLGVRPHNARSIERRILCYQGDASDDRAAVPHDTRFWPLRPDERAWRLRLGGGWQDG